MFTGKSLLITGGTGSFGNAILKSLLEADFREIRIFSRDENKQHEMRSRLKNPRVKFFIGDVRNSDAVSDVVRGVDYIFHAAALKQVPSCEFFPIEAVRTNVLGAENVMRAAIEHEVKRCVVLSTDKAVYPINAMGLSKAMMEKVMVAKSRECDPGKTVLCATRYGNVMASRGSVIPLFIDQLLSGKSLTLTDPNMTRFLMSLDESVKLVLYAFQKSRRYFCAEGAGLHHKGSCGGLAGIAEGWKRYRSDWDETWREALRNARVARRNGCCAGCWRLLPYSGRHERSQLQ